MIAANILAGLGPRQASDPFRFGGDIAHGSDQKLLVAKAAGLAEIRLRIG
jgi:hypothetical protein